MKYVYVLKSVRSAIYYVGIAQDVEARLKEHNRGKSKFTKGHLPWEIVYQEIFEDWESARKREKYLKSAAGKKMVEERKNN